MKRIFEELLNEEVPRMTIDRIEWNQSMVDLIRKEEVWSAMRK